MDEKSYKIIENLLSRAQYIAASNRKSFMNNSRYKKIEDKIDRETSAVNK
jgi:hypothetical protein